ncbi:isoprenyl transferase [Halonatronum saccharophilum]|uniref:isoprenyl transferase n=1 Tax=Halonatronum saccharophilum TaxID=150060 RepID=UPI00048A270D
MNNRAALDIDKIKEGPIPRHIAVIMDGNGRWAKTRGLPRTAGHQKGVARLKEFIRVATQLGVEYITTYAFSTENWKRPEKEVDFLMDLFEKVFLEEVEHFNREGVKVNIIGNKNRLPSAVKKRVEEVMDVTKGNSRIVVNVALDYGGRFELVNVVKEIAQKLLDGELDLTDVDEDLIGGSLYTKDQPDPDLLIRPGGEKRISNFLLWQLAYSEVYFSDVYWPNFKKNELLSAVYEFQQRERRFGGLKGSGGE